MRELELDGIHDDDEHVILTDSDGERYTLRIDAALRASVRRDRPALGAIRASESTPLRPRDIQLMLRQGRSAEEIAESADVSLDHVRRYEGPVLAEREFTAQRARQLPVGRGDGPSLGEMVAERLAARRAGEDVRWDAWRRLDGTWELELSFSAGGRTRTAHWVADLVRRSITAEDDEARWLIDEDASAFEPGQGRARLTSIRRSVYDIEADGSFEDGQAPQNRPRPLAWRPRDEAPHDALSPGTRGRGTPSATEDDPRSERSRREDAQRDHPTAIDVDELGALNARRGLRSVPRSTDPRSPDTQESRKDAVWESLDEPAAPAPDSPADADEEALAEHSGQLFAMSSGSESADSFDEPVDPAADSRDLAEDPAPEKDRPAPENDTVELTPLPGFDDAEGRRSPSEADPSQDAERTPAPKKRSKTSSKRASMPSWDEIVFGSKHD